jgi:hyperosmotically inducible protein
MKLIPFLIILSLSSVALLAPLSIRAADTTADNSANNSTDNNGNAITAQSQSNDDADVKVTRSIRRALVKDSSLSVYAHNVKIITTKDHVVYLRGAVSSSDDVSKILSLATAHSHGDHVENQLSVSK